MSVAADPTTNICFQLEIQRLKEIITRLGNEKVQLLSNINDKIDTIEILQSNNEKYEQYFLQMKNSHDNFVQSFIFDFFY